MAVKKANTAPNPFEPSALEKAEIVAAAAPKKRGHSTKNIGKTLPVGSIAPKARTGRPTQFREEFIELAHRLTLLKADFKHEDMAKVFQVSLDTFKAWLVAHPAFSAAIARAKTPSDAEVVNSLKRRALGYEYEEEQAVKVKENGNDVIKIIKIKKHLPPDFNAMSLWLRNRRGAEWKAMPEPNDDAGTKPIGKVTVSIQQAPAPEPISAANQDTSAT